MDTSFFSTSLPPSVANSPFILGISIAGLLLVLCLSLQWAQRLVWKLVDDPHPMRHPLTVLRMIFLCLLASVICFVGPYTVMTMLWPEAGDLGANVELMRAKLSYWNRIFGIIATIPLCIAWFLGLISQWIIEAQVVREPIPVHLWPRWAKLRNSCGIALLVVLISILIAAGH